jgi:6-phosphofructokinase 1
VSATPSGKLLVVQGGGPTAVLNTTLYAIIDEAARSGRFTQVLGGRFSMEGVLKGELINLSSLPADELQRLRTSPGASLGSSRRSISPPEMEQILRQLRASDIRSLLMIGGNGTMRGAAAIDAAARAKKMNLCVVGIPKTIDNDIANTDRCPGYASAARYVAQAVRDLGMDVRTLPQPVSIFETMGRSVGWLAAASVLGRIDEGHSPHLVYLPERPFDMDRFIADVDEAVRRHGWAVAVVAEGLRNARGEPVYESQASSQRDALQRALPGGVASYLADVVTQRLKIRCRSEKPGLCGRASALHVSPVDRSDAEAVGRQAVRIAIEGQSGQMISLLPLATSNDPPRCQCVSLSSEHVERAIPSQWLGEGGGGGNSPVAPAFIEYVRRLVGELCDYPVPLCDRSEQGAL